MFMALTTLMLELTLVRVFDVIWYPNMAYMVITLAMFCFGLSGVYSSLRPLPHGMDPRRYLSVLAFLFSIFSLLIMPALNQLPFDFDILYQSPMKGAALFLVMYLILIIPFFLAGLAFTTVFSSYAARIQTLYFWDLAGAAVGCLLLIPFLPSVGPGGILFLSAAFGLIASGCFSSSKTWTATTVVFSILLVAVPFLHKSYDLPYLSKGYFEFKDHINKRGVKGARDKGLVELSHWDPISKIDIIDYGKMKHVAYDGGSQSSYIIPFSGDFTQLRQDVLNKKGYHFYGSNVWVSHALKQDSGQEVLVIGAAGGSETKAALTFGAAHVDAVELVGYVIEIGKNIYNKYNGNIFNDPRVNALRGEGRSFLRSSNKQYDIIQMYSNHTSSSIAAGTGAMATTYLQTVEAYKEYFTHLKDDGILHINHHVYPRMVSTAALAWKELGRKKFHQHIIVLEAVKEDFQDNLPTMLIKMEPWTQEELDHVQSYFPSVIQPVVNPLHPESGMLSADFFTGELPKEINENAKYHLAPSTDNKPYFNFLRKSNKELAADPETFLNYSTASLLNSQLKNGWIPSDVIHLIVTGIASLIFTFFFLLIPMFFSSAGKTPWPGKIASLVYFSSLGAGFIIVELVFIQIFMKLIGYPLYTYTVVVFALLLAAGAGSAVSQKMNITPANRWLIPFVGTLITNILVLLIYPFYFSLFLQTPTIVRMIAATVLIFPVGLFMGMPFPLGILTIKNQAQGSIAWAWAMNGLFTVIGGISSVLLSIYSGFRITLIAAMMIYTIALLAYFRLRTVTAQSSR
ncbi:MAG: hypothetical protein D3924_06825 [Candidatus Electrothrix sp. AR4]|nr:hypothetical protein [Candidatus Electrothrix sp. AR4]